jgi:MGT family glycosyltransferase
MAHILIYTIGSKSHILPFTPVVRELKKRGHRVLWLCDEACRSLIEGSGAEFRSTRRAPPTAGIVEALRDVRGRARAGAIAEHMLVRPVAGLLEDLREALAGFPADLLLADSFCFAARFLSESGGPPWAILNVTVCMAWTPEVGPHGPGFPPSRSVLDRLKYKAILARLVKTAYARPYDELDSIRAGLGLRPLERTHIFNHLVSPYLLLQPCTPLFEYPRRPFPASLRFIGPLLPSVGPDFIEPEWWAELDSGKPVVLLTQGTVANSGRALIQTAAEALADEELLVVLTTGGSSSCLPDSLPANFRVADYIPYAAILPKVSVFVTNGGYGAVNAALAHGVPIVGAGDSEEKPEICARVAWSGAGIDLRSGSPGAAELKSAVRRLLSDPRYKDRAKAIQADYAAHDAPREACDHLERVMAARSPQA